MMYINLMESVISSRWGADPPQRFFSREQILSDFPHSVVIYLSSVIKCLDDKYLGLA